MRTQSLLVAALAASVNAHGMLKSIQGANGVEMPGLTVADGTPRDCTSNGCGSQADTAIIRDREMAEVGPLGRTQGNGPVKAETMIANFMGGATAPTNNGKGTGVEDNIPASAGGQAAAKSKNAARQLLGGLLGGLGGGGGAGKKVTGPAETMVAASAGAGASQGLPTCSDSGAITMTFYQINQDGAGPLEAAVDGTSGGTDAAAFQDAEVTTNVPGLGIQGLSLATATEFPVEVQMPQGMTCDASVGGAQNVCVVRVRNAATATGPFGGSAAFTQTAAGRKRALAYRLKKRMEFRA
ncbi:MAS1 protein [Plectosphaerella cucumerina]|uniref:MAS1 protein n=1 Tax=Plectosphaerella cucumerina TaxID=40658 RepID=A0A8K0TR38_9PEZI|nr:MAS1 protein [Plectosphaerella cucumerina]